MGQATDVVRLHAQSLMEALDGIGDRLSGMYRTGSKEEVGADVVAGPVAHISRAGRKPRA